MRCEQLCKVALSFFLLFWQLELIFRPISFNKSSQVKNECGGERLSPVALVIFK